MKNVDRDYDYNYKSMSPVFIVWAIAFVAGLIVLARIGAMVIVWSLQ